MSYEPTLIIKKEDLDKHADKFERFWEWDKDSDEKRLMEYLRYVYEKHDVCEIDGIKLTICNPEFTSFNREVRERLTEWGVQYGIIV